MKTPGEEAARPPGARASERRDLAYVSAGPPARPQAKPSSEDSSASLRKPSPDSREVARLAGRLAVRAQLKRSQRHRRKLWGPQTVGRARARQVSGVIVRACSLDRFQRGRAAVCDKKEEAEEEEKRAR